LGIFFFVVVVVIFVGGFVVVSVSAAVCETRWQ